MKEHPPSRRAKEKGQVERTTWPLRKSYPETDNPNYLEYVLLVEPVLVDMVSFFCAQAPRLNAPAARATIIIAFRIFI